MQLKPLSLILPCAGEGKRLGLSLPKELYEIIPRTKIIDFSLSHIFYAIKQNPQLKKYLKIIVVIKKGKEDVFEHVKNELKNIQTNCVYFNNHYHEWPGSVYSANKKLSEWNLVLLPDSVISLSKKSPFQNLQAKNLIEQCIEHIQKHSVVLGIMKCQDLKKLTHLGACYVKNNTIQKFQDKPNENLTQYNSFWGCYGFQKNVAKELYQFLWESVQHKKNDYVKKSFYPMVSFTMNNYYDLGTWESIQQFKKSRLIARFLQDT